MSISIEVADNTGSIFGSVEISAAHLCSLSLMDTGSPESPCSESPSEFLSLGLLRFLSTGSILGLREHKGHAD